MTNPEQVVLEPLQLTYRVEFRGIDGCKLERP